jgi:flavodoxin
LFDTRKDLIRLKRCVVYYSHTSNTKSVAEKIKNVDLLVIKPAVDDPNILNPTLVEIPDISSYDYVIFATPVHGF